ISEYRIAPFSLYGGTVRTYHVDRVAERTCRAGQTAKACGDEPVARTDTGFAIEPDLRPGEAMRVVPQTVTRYEGTEVAGGARRTTTTYDVSLTANRLLVLPRTIDDTELTSVGYWKRHRYVEHDYDARGRVTETRQQLDEAGTVARTQHCYAGTGALLATRRPRLVERAERAGSCFDGQTAIRYEYDPWQLYANITVNELGHRFIRSLDLGTGQPTFAGGPFRAGKGWPVEVYSLDGFGRVTAVAHTVNGPWSYAQAVVERYRY